MTLIKVLSVLLSFVTWNQSIYKQQVNNIYISFVIYKASEFQTKTKRETKGIISRLAKVLAMLRIDSLCYTKLIFL